MTDFVIFAKRRPTLTIFTRLGDITLKTAIVKHACFI